MLWITLLIGLLIALAVGAYVVRPLLQTGPAPVLVDDDRLTELLTRKDSVLRAIKELEFDHQVGKLNDEDYGRFDQSLRRQAIVLIQQLEKLAPQSSQLDEMLEAEIVRQRQVVNPQAGPPQPAIYVANTQSPPPAKPAQRFCTNCGAPASEGHHFCANCGAPLTAPVSAGAEVT
jgi:hypothetical protein